MPETLSEARRRQEEYEAERLQRTKSFLLEPRPMLTTAGLWDAVRYLWPLMLAYLLGYLTHFVVWALTTP